MNHFANIVGFFAYIAAYSLQLTGALLVIGPTKEELIETFKIYFSKFSGKRKGSMMIEVDPTEQRIAYQKKQVGFRLPLLRLFRWCYW